jgi:hypothetical protein
MLDIALKYASRGWHVFPLHGITEEGKCTCGKNPCTDAGKHPITKNGLKGASSDTEIIKSLFTEPLCNIGIVTGKISNLTVIDIDVGPGKMGAESWSALIAEGGEPNTLMSKTGGGGMHVLFKYNSALKTGSNRLGKGIDVRNDKGYIVAPPSKHRSGNLYEWMNEAAELDDLPPHLLSAKKETRGRKRKDDPTARKYTAEQVAEMLQHIQQDDRDTWRQIGIILGREFSRSDEAWTVYVEWSAKWGGKKGRGHDEIMREAFFEISQSPSTDSKELSIGTIIHLAIKGGWTPKGGAVPLNNFIYFAPGNNFIYRPTASYWVKEAVDCAVGKINSEGNLVHASAWLKTNFLATSMTKSPSLEGDYIKGFDCREGELFAESGSAIFNTYKPATIELGDARAATKFIEHVNKVFSRPGDSDQFLDYMAHRVQHPGEKPRFALLISGDQGVGKDTAIEFCVPAIGAWNVANIEPAALDAGFNEYSASVLVRVSEAANLHDMSKWAFNERMKVLIAGQPDYISINPKYGQKYSIRVHCGVIITTNHLMSGIYLPPDDRRYDVIESSTKSEMGLNSDDETRAYFEDLWNWFDDGGASHIAAFLNYRDVSKFSAANGQRKTSAHNSVVAEGFAADHWLLDALAELNDPDVVRSDAIMEVLSRNENFNAKDFTLKIRKTILRHGYCVFENDAAPDKRWLIDKKRFSAYYKMSAGLTKRQVFEKISKITVSF